MCTRPLLSFLFCLVMLFTETVAYAAGRISIRPGVMQFDYEETAEDGSFLDSEKGTIPGLEAIVEYMFSELVVVKLGFSQYAETVNYNGRTLAGAPHQTQTDESLQSISANLLLSIPYFSDDLQLQAGISVNQWERDILPANGVLGLYEEYSWYKANLGLSYTLYRSPLETYKVFAGITRTISPAIKIDLTQLGYGQLELDLVEKTGFEFGSDWIYTINDYAQTGISLSYHYWEFGRSNDRTVSDGVNTLTIAEPDSETRLVLFQLLFLSEF